MARPLERLALESLSQLAAVTREMLRYKRRYRRERQLRQTAQAERDQLRLNLESVQDYAATVKDRRYCQSCGERMFP